VRAFNTLSFADKIKYYNKNVGFLTKIYNGNNNAPDVGTQELEASVFTKTKSLKLWK
jgi:hypothetical protein